MKAVTIALMSGLAAALAATSAHAQDTTGTHMMNGKAMSDAEMAAMPANPGWQFHAHGTLNLVADDQSGPRGDQKTFAEGMVMLMASRAMGPQDDIQFDVMLSPDPFMGKSGYPLLLQSGETADGVHPLIDRQHPHELLSGASVTLMHRFNNGDSGYVSAGYPGDFAFGPTAFMHRKSGENFPTAPISHHWLDSGHVTMGVVTGGYTRGPLTMEVSAFTGREPDQNRFNLDPVHLDSTAIRAMWQVSHDLTAQASWARQVSPEQLEPDINLRKASVSLDYSHVFPVGTWDTTLAFGSKRAEHHFGCTTASLLECGSKTSNAYLFENTLHFNGPWLGLARFERVYNDELAAQPASVGKTEVGGLYRVNLNGWTQLGLGVAEQFNSVPDTLKPVYGKHPTGTVIFLQLRFDSMDIGGSMAGMKM